MKSTALILCLAAAVAAHAQTAAKHATPAAKHTATAHTPAAAAADVKYPEGIKPVPGLKKSLFSLRYQDIKIGTGADAEPMKMYKVKYTGWRAADGVIFDAWDKHPSPVLDKDGKPVMGDDGKPKMGDPQPASFPVGLGRVIPGFDQGFGGMKVGGIRRIFIPWQLGYGMHAMADRDKDHPGIPAKSDLVFDVELVDMAELPAPQAHPGMGGAGATGAPGSAPHPATPPPSGAPPNAGATTVPSGSTQTPPPQK
jgi:peptidylprolyl isomerase